MEFGNPYETEYWKVYSGIMRPGGLELTQRLLELSRLQGGAHVLDLGCGCGAATEFLVRQGFKAVGMDQSPVLLEDARERYPHLTFVQGDALAMPFANGTLDAVLLECVLSVVPAGEALAECARVTCALGRLLISDVYDPDGVGTPMSRDWWEAQLEVNGLHCTYFEDRTRDLRNFVAQRLWDTGSLKGLCGCMSCEIPAKPGYFALIAEKGGM